MKKYLLQETGREDIKESELKTIFKGVSISEQTVIATVENGCCAEFRKGKRQDSFFKGQNLFNLTSTEECIMLQEYGSLKWVPIKFNKNTGIIEKVGMGERTNTE